MHGVSLNRIYLLLDIKIGLTLETFLKGLLRFIPLGARSSSPCPGSPYEAKQSGLNCIRLLMQRKAGV